jgi:hypothetical protein
LNPNIPAKFEEITSKALEKDRDIRYQHASDIKADLKRVKRDLESGKVTSSDSAKFPWSRRATLIGGAVAFAFVVAMVAVALFHFGSSSGTRISSVAVLPFANASADPVLLLNSLFAAAAVPVVNNSAINYSASPNQIIIIIISFFADSFFSEAHPRL